jgi:hypothetical protein
MESRTWTDTAVFSVAYVEETVDGELRFAVVLINRDGRRARIALPDKLEASDWHVAFVTHGEAGLEHDRTINLPARSVALVRNDPVHDR